MGYFTAKDFKINTLVEAASILAKLSSVLLAWFGAAVLTALPSAA